MDKEDTVIVDFCAHCTAMLEPIDELPFDMGLGSLCQNCGEPVADRSNRLQGTFSKEDYKKLVEGGIS